MKIKSIALVETKAVKTHVFSRVYLPRMGLPFLSGLMKSLGYEVETFFQEKAPVDIDHLCGFDLVGISSLTSTVNEAYRLGSLLKGRGKLVIMGGPHVSAMAEEALRHCDYVVRGEGEATFAEMVAKMNGGGDLSDVPGISYLRDGVLVQNPSSVTKVDMEEMPQADFSSCKAFKGPEEYPAQLMFSRGCPFDCSFCSVTTTFGRKYRYKTKEQLIAEMAPMLGRTINFIDDNFAANPRRTKDLLKTMIALNKVPRRYSCQLRIDAARDEELLDLLKRTNCRIAYIGMESINPETLKAYDKGQTVEEIVASIKGFKRHNIGIHGMFVLGGDHDTPQTIRDTTDFAIEAGLDTIQLCALTPFPGTAVHGQMVAEKRILHQDWDHYDGLHCVIRPTRMTPYELQNGIIEEMRRFYTLPRAFKINLQKRWRFKYRIGGRYLVNRWKSENAAYFDYLKTV